MHLHLRSEFLNIGNSKRQYKTLNNLSKVHTFQNVKWEGKSFELLHPDIWLQKRTFCHLKYGHNGHKKATFGFNVDLHLISSKTNQMGSRINTAHRNLVAHTCTTPKASSMLCQCAKDKRKHFWPSTLKMAANNQAWPNRCLHNGKEVSNLNSKMKCNSKMKYATVVYGGKNHFYIIRPNKDLKYNLKAYNKYAYLMHLYFVFAQISRSS